MHTNFDVSNNLNEGVTEYFALKSLGLNWRFDKYAKYILYEEYVGLVKDTIKSGGISEQQLQNAYFAGNLSGLKPLLTAYIALRKKIESSGLYGSKVYS